MNEIVVMCVVSFVAAALVYCAYIISRDDEKIQEQA